MDFRCSFWSIDIAGESPSISSTSGFSISPRNCLAYEDKLSTYLLCPSAYRVSNAKEDFPDPESPVITTSLSLGISKLMFLNYALLRLLLLYYYSC